tara:strand:- start:54639 stop:54872 length:234 start_codon:yes stop_codon:yes gene_type:complete
VKIKRFEKLLDQYGWDLNSWPTSCRKDANKLLEDDAEAAELLRSLKSVEDLLENDSLPMGKHQAVDDIFAEIDEQET